MRVVESAVIARVLPQVLPNDNFDNLPVINDVKYFEHYVSSNKWTEGNPDAKMGVEVETYIWKMQKTMRINTIIFEQTIMSKSIYDGPIISLWLLLILIFDASWVKQNLTHLQVRIFFFFKFTLVWQNAQNSASEHERETYLSF